MARAALDDGLGPSLARRVIVRVPWPPSDDDETALLGARLALPGLNLAVVIQPEEAEAIFRYFNRLGFAWFGLPPEPAWRRQWPAALQAIGRRWCLDGGAAAPMEPVASAFGRVAAQRLGHRARPWRLRVIAPGQAPAVMAWSASAHALLLSDPLRARTFPLDDLTDAGRVWQVPLARLCEQVDPDGLGDYLGSRASRPPVEVTHDA